MKEKLIIWTISMVIAALITLLIYSITGFIGSTSGFIGYALGGATAIILFTDN